MLTAFAAGPTADDVVPFRHGLEVEAPVADKFCMRAVAQRLVWIIGLFCLIFAVMGVLAFSPVTVALSATAWFLSRRARLYLSEQADINAPTPDLQYWARSLLFRTLGLMSVGVLVAAAFIAGGISFHLSIHSQVLLTALLIGSMIVVTKLTLPGFFAASWEVYYTGALVQDAGKPARERRKRRRSSLGVSRFIVRIVAVMIVLTSIVGSFSLMQAIRLKAPQAGMMAILSSPSGDSPR